MICLKLTHLCQMFLTTTRKRCFGVINAHFVLVLHRPVQISRCNLGYLFFLKRKETNDSCSLLVKNSHRMHIVNWWSIAVVPEGLMLEHINCYGESEFCYQLLDVQSPESLGVCECLWSWQKQVNQMTNNMFRLEQNLNVNSCKIKSFTEPREKRKKIKNVRTYYRVRLITDSALNDLWILFVILELYLFWDIKKTNNTQ